jgi:hypothetical protein
MVDYKHRNEPSSSTVHLVIKLNATVSSQLLVGTAGTA